MNDVVTSPDVLLGPLLPDLIRIEVLADLLEATAERLPHQTALILVTST